VVVVLEEAILGEQFGGCRSVALVDGIPELLQ
jgi:hypothetical protein